MARIREQIPNFITLCNLLCGAVAIVLIFKGMLVTGAILIFLAAFFDLIDGAAARWLKVHSELGKELDSLADLVSFGLAPSFILYQYLERLTLLQDGVFSMVLPAVSLLIAAFTAIRLARFNTGPSDAEFFTGLPSPANGMLIASLPMIQLFNPAYAHWLLDSIPVLTGLILISCWMLVSEIPLISLKFHDFSWKSNQTRYLFLLTALISILLLKFACVPLIAILYFIFSYIHTNHEKIFSRD